MLSSRLSPSSLEQEPLGRCIQSGVSCGGAAWDWERLLPLDDGIFPHQSPEWLIRPRMVYHFFHRGVWLDLLRHKPLSELQVGNNKREKSLISYLAN